MLIKRKPLSVLFALMVLSLLWLPAAVRGAGPGGSEGPPTLAIDLGPAAGSLRPELRDSSGDGANDPPGLLAEDRLPVMTSLAARLSRDRGWLTAEALEVLGERSLSLDELFSEAPRYVTLDGRAYRIKVEKVGGLWGGFQADKDPFVVFLTQEVYDRLGTDRAIGYRDGEEMILRAGDFERLPAIALTLAGVPAEPAVVIPPTAPELGLAPISLGIAKTPGRRPAPPPAAPQTASDVDLSAIFAPELSSLSAAATCISEVAPTGCSGSTLLCPSGYSPYFLVRTITIYDDHEGCCFKGSPEIELYPLAIDQDSPPGGTAAQTQWIFDGRTVTDLAGRSRFLPDINNTGQAYTMSGGLAVFPTSMGTKWASTLIEDDDTAGQLKMDNQKINVFQVVDTGGQIYNDAKKMEVLKLIKDAVKLIDILGLTNDSDDLYQDSLAVTNGLFCSTGVGQPFPHVYTLTTTDWQLQGYFACETVTCTSTSCCGDGVCQSACGESYSSCSSDCHCGNGICDSGESSFSCPSDCDPCGNGICESNLGEDSTTCPADCPAGCTAIICPE